MPTPKALKTRSCLIGCAKQIILDEGIARLSMDRLAEAADLSKGAVMYHFKTKRALLAALLEDYAEHLDAQFKLCEARWKGAPEETILPGYIDWFRAFDRDNQGWALIGTSLLSETQRDPELAEPVRAWYRRLFERLRGMPEALRPKAFLSIMALEGLFFTHKFGLDQITSEEKDSIYEAILGFFPRAKPGPSAAAAPVEEPPAAARAGG